METQSIIDVLIGVVILLISAILKVLWDAVRSLQKDMTALEVALPTKYVAKDEFRGEIKEIKSLLRDIAAKLDMKEDKSK